MASGLALTGEVFGPTAERSTPYFTLRTSASNAEAVPGQRLTLTLDFEMAPGHHAYAPGDHTYRALALKLEPNPYVHLGAQQAPLARPFEFKPLQETVPVYEGRFRINQDVVLAVRDDIAPLLLSPDPTLVLQGLGDCHSHLLLLGSVFEVLRFGERAMFRKERTNLVDEV